MQQLLKIYTKTDNVRDEAFGWSGIDDPFTLEHDKPMWKKHGKINARAYLTVLHAMADGWHLLGIPVPHMEGETQCYTWWLVKEARMERDYKRPDGDYNYRTVENDHSYEPQES